MPLKEKVALLKAGNGLSQGSAWFIDDQYALTALHCVRGKDGFPYEDICLKFSHLQEEIAVEIASTASELDVALLKIKDVSQKKSATPILAVARNLGGTGDAIKIHGHPSQSLTSSPDGVQVSGKINDPCLAYQGKNGNLGCIAIQCSNINVPALNGSSGLHGISGGPVILDQNSAIAAVLGLVIEDGMNGGFIYVIPLTAIAEKFPQVQTALESSPHVNLHDHRICISLATDDAPLDWSAGISPADVGQLWQEPNLGKYELHSNVNLPQLGTAAKALTRLAIYSGIQSIHVPDKDAWAKRVTAANFSKYPLPALKQVAAMGTLPAKAQNIAAKELAETIHTALNKVLLDFLNGTLFACLDGNASCDLGCEIEQRLRNAMWDIWQNWYPSLCNDATLLKSFLIRVFSLDADAPINDEALLAIGPSDGAKQQLLHATMYVLAIAAAGISTQPQIHELGNFAVGTGTGHSSGVKDQMGKRISLVIAAHNWKSDVIFLPFLQKRLLIDASKAVALTKPDGTKGFPQKNNFPIAVTADDDFLEALSAGASAVLKYYTDRVAEVQLQKNAMKSPTRTEALDA